MGTPNNIANPRSWNPSVCCCACPPNFTVMPAGGVIDATRFPTSVLAPGTFRPATFIEMSLENLQRALLLGAAMVIVVLVFFLYEWRTAIISLSALPLSLPIVGGAAATRNANRSARHCGGAE